ncbi:MAG: tripartite tricarboxylate transporter TctB family protein [Hyphomicrobiales bacterium]|nr:tripartite tricarboxylate transporter TctB family protein [Hyphomicrobiales bacterium]
MPLRNLIAAVVLIALTAAYGYFTTALPQRSLPHTPGPDFFPWLIFIIVMALSVALLIRGLYQLRSTGWPQHLEFAFPRRGLALIIWFAVIVAKLPYAGFLIGSILFFAGLMAFYGADKPLAILIWSIVIPTAVFFLFRDVFLVLLPSGKWLVI